MNKKQKCTVKKKKSIIKMQKHESLCFYFCMAINISNFGPVILSGCKLYITLTKLC